jgi:transcriptional regulator with XRE-family HTH domain
MTTLSLDELLNLLSAMGVSARSIALMANCSHSTLSNARRGKRGRLGPATANALAAACGIKAVLVCDEFRFSGNPTWGRK